MNLKLKALTKSIWVFHAACSPCNNCDIEVLDLLTPRHDVERFGITLVGSVRHADALLVTGIPNYKTKERLKKLYAQAPQPCLVVAIGNCACGRIMFKDSYNSPCPVDEVVPVSVYVPGCPPKPEAMIAGVVRLIHSAAFKPSPLGRLKNTPPSVSILSKPLKPCRPECEGLINKVKGK